MIDLVAVNLSYQAYPYVPLLDWQKALVVQDIAPRNSRKEERIHEISMRFQRTIDKGQKHLTSPTLFPQARTVNPRTLEGILLIVPTN